MTRGFKPKCQMVDLNSGGRRENGENTGGGLGLWGGIGLRGVILERLPRLHLAVCLDPGGMTDVRMEVSISEQDTFV